MDPSIGLVPLPNIPATLGAVLVGGLFGTFLSGIVSMQTAFYFQLYPNDKTQNKVIVTGIWLLDIMHTGMVCASIWIYLISHYGDSAITDYIAWTVAATIALTSFITVAVHCFLIHRIFTISKQNLPLTIPITLLAVLRVALALVTTSRMIQYRSFSVFEEMFRWVYTAGLCAATAVDIVIAVTLCIFLHKSRTGFSNMDGVINSITLYTIESGMLTGLVTGVALVCWLIMPYNLIFLGIHFAISKLYANAFLATLNARKVLKGRAHSSGDQAHSLPRVAFPDSLSRGGLSQGFRFSTRPADQSRKMQISVEKTVETTIHDPTELYTPTSASRFVHDDESDIGQAA